MIHIITSPPTEIYHFLNSRLLTTLLRLGIRKGLSNSTSAIRSGTTTPRCVHTDAREVAHRQRWFLLELQRKLGG